VRLEPGQVLCEAGERLNHVYFLTSGIASKLAVFEDGAEIECALVGREGVVGATDALGGRAAITRDISHMAVRADCMEAGRFAAIARSSAAIRDRLDHYQGWELSCAIRNGACHARHPAEPRLCRWLLTCCDMLEGPEIRLPQEVFAKMLGVQRTSVNPILRRFRAEGLVELGRSRLKVLDRAALHARACECYDVLRATAAEYWPADTARRRIA
jgi:CRP-like cAMP-binding protein